MARHLDVLGLLYRSETKNLRARHAARRYLNGIRRYTDSQVMYSSIEPSIAARMGSRNINIANPTCT